MQTGAVPVGGSTGVLKGLEIELPRSPVTPLLDVRLKTAKTRLREDTRTLTFAALFTVAKLGAARCAPVDGWIKMREPCVPWDTNQLWKTHEP